jgi:hypothetical protein
VLVLTTRDRTIRFGGYDMKKILFAGVLSAAVALVLNLGGMRRKLKPGRP